MSFWEEKSLTSCFFLVGNGIRFLGCINAFASIRSLIRSLDYDGAKREMYTHKEGDGRYGLLIGYTE